MDSIKLHKLCQFGIHRAISYETDPSLLSKRMIKSAPFLDTKNTTLFFLAPLRQCEQISLIVGQNCPGRNDIDDLPTLEASRVLCISESPNPVCDLSLCSKLSKYPHVGHRSLTTHRFPALGRELGSRPELHC